MVRDMIKKSIIGRKIILIVKKIQIGLMGEKKWVSKNYESIIGKSINIDDPKTLNEKIVWLKVNYIQNNYRQCCDKYLLHRYLKERLGTDYAPKLLFVTKDPEQLTLDKINEFPCIIKVSNGSGSNLIVHNKSEFTDDYIRKFFKKEVFSACYHTIVSREHQYVDKKPYIVVEQLLQDSEGNIPNDYKFLYINGKLQFIYCSVDRLGANVRQVYDKDWNRLHFIWVKNANETLFKKYDESESIERPRFYEEMVKVSYELAKDFPLVRIDFYETEQRIYIGEITLHHGSGTDKFYPDKYDAFYGEKFVLPKANRKTW